MQTSTNKTILPPIKVEEEEKSREEQTKKEIYRCRRKGDFEALNASY